MYRNLSVAGLFIILAFALMQNQGVLMYSSPAIETVATATALVAVTAPAEVNVTPATKVLAATAPVPVVPIPNPPTKNITVSDSAIHMLPQAGIYGYNTWNPGNPGFINIGQTFNDPIFGSTIRRLTKDYPLQSESDIYSKNGFWNANGTRMIHSSARGLQGVIDTRTGTVVQSDVPGNFDGSFDPVNPNIWYWFDENKLEQYDITTGQSATLKAFAANLGPLGGSVDWVDRNGRYMILNVGGSIRVWDKSSDTLYAGALAGNFGGGWAGITPDGQYVVTNDEVYKSYKINHAAKSIDTLGTTFWSLCGGHGDLASASDGKNYLITFECHSEAAIYRVDITLPQKAEDTDKQRKENIRLIDVDWTDDGHFSCASKGVNQDWCFISLESTDNNFGNPGAWRPYKDEIVMVEMVAPFRIRRLAHHRSQSTEENYYHQPRVNVNWTGDYVVWASNFGYPKTGYSDIYGIEIR